MPILMPCQEEAAGSDANVMVPKGGALPCERGASSATIPRPSAGMAVQATRDDAGAANTPAALRCRTPPRRAKSHAQLSVPAPIGPRMMLGVVPGVPQVGA